jgi:hypothetical protein
VGLGVRDPREHPDAINHLEADVTLARECVQRRLTCSMGVSFSMGRGRFRQLLTETSWHAAKHRPRGIDENQPAAQSEQF